MLSPNESKSTPPDRSDLVAYWSVPLLDGVHTVEFEHGTKTGKRILRVDGKEVLRKDWMFKLVGDIKFTLGKQEAKCELLVDPIPHFSFCYSLLVDGKPLEKFTEKQNQTIQSWSVIQEGKRYRVIFEKQTLEIWVNGEKVEPEINFEDQGTGMKFLLGKSDAIIRSIFNEKQNAITYDLIVDDQIIENV